MFIISRHVLIISSLLFVYSRSEEALQVRIHSKDDFCMVVPKDLRTSIGDSEYDGGEVVWCQGRKTSTSAGTFQGNFWTNVAVSTPKSDVIQMTGCINVNSCDRLNPQDSGGQYDSHGGNGNRGNPAGSRCENYPYYVELIEPSANRACIRCCKNAQDCLVSGDKAGCPTVIPGNYFGCT